MVAEAVVRSHDSSAPCHFPAMAAPMTPSKFDVSTPTGSNGGGDGKLRKTQPSHGKRMADEVVDVDEPRSPPRLPARGPPAPGLDQGGRFEILDKWATNLAQYLEDLDHTVRSNMKKVVFLERLNEQRYQDMNNIVMRIGGATENLEKQDKSNSATLKELGDTLIEAVNHGFPQFNDVYARLLDLESGAGIGAPPGIEEYKQKVVNVEGLIVTLQANQAQAKDDMLRLGGLADSALTRLQESDQNVKENFNIFQAHVEQSHADIKGTMEKFQHHSAQVDIRLTAGVTAMKQEMQERISKVYVGQSAGTGLGASASRSPIEKQISDLEVTATEHQNMLSELRLSFSGTEVVVADLLEKSGRCHCEHVDILETKVNDVQCQLDHFKTAIHGQQLLGQHPQVLHQAGHLHHAVLHSHAGASVAPTT